MSLLLRLGPLGACASRMVTTGTARTGLSASWSTATGSARLLPKPPQELKDRPAPLVLSTEDTRTEIGEWPLTLPCSTPQLTSLASSSSGSCNGIDLGFYDTGLHIASVL